MERGREPASREEIAADISEIEELLVDCLAREGEELTAALEVACARRPETPRSSRTHASFGRHHLAAAYARFHRDDEAEALLEESIGARRELGTHGDELLAAGLYELAQLRARRDELSEAEPLLLEASLRPASADASERETSRRARTRLAELYEKRGDAERAAGLRRVLEAAAGIK